MYPFRIILMGTRLACGDKTQVTSDIQKCFKSGEGIKDGIATNPVTEPKVVSANIPCMSWRKFSHDSRMIFFKTLPLNYGPGTYYA